MNATEEYDVVIVGGGAAGLSAALLLGRARRRVAVVDAGRPRNERATHVHGYLTRDGVSPARLLDRAREEVAGYGVELIQGTAEKVRADRSVILEDGRVLTARQVILASGLRDVLPDVEGADERWGRDFFQCPYCHGWELRDRVLAVLGTAGSSVQQALLVRQFSDNVTLFTHDMEDLDEDARSSLGALGVKVVAGRVEALVSGRDSLSSVRLDNGELHPCEALFYEPAATVDASIVELADCSTSENGCLSTDEHGRTGVDGVWAVGNAADPAAQVIVAAGDAYRVAVAVNAELIVDDVARAKAGSAAGDVLLPESK
ncbi:FAD-dependent oxidoreductase [Arthrobacter sp. JZ12]|uniref:NAD(P)/FAD-dependent oxidoreductase n=1 Tax=Arthrobacter sp. JZ12 TaxID=2654190 RepID=UPI002B4A724C|nr:NAD(P)/FAD-dependent oxidoreductase [Arthrobacter sp. JZ12]WRH24089.1 FAD-dependent oxidoreductase [Arthrobacter sp. JZ12]